jgi:hypothetical protein
VEKWRDTVSLVWLAWIGLAFYFSLDFFPDSHGRPILDINADGATTITDFWILIKNVSYSATAFPIVYVLSILENATPGIYNFFELDEISGIYLIFIGFIMWISITLCITLCVAAIEERGDNWSKRRAAKQLDAVRSGKRDRFP